MAGAALILEFQFGEDVLVAEGFAGQLVGENGDGVRQCIAVLLADGYFFVWEVDEFVVEGLDLSDGNDITPVDAAEEVPGKEPVPLLQCHQDQERGSVLQDQPGIVFPGFDVDDLAEIDFYISALMTDKEE